jgi:hypothetical protein
MAKGNAGESKALERSSLKKRIERLNREEVLQISSDLISYLHVRACSQRFREFPTDKARVTFQRVMVAAISAYAGLLRDEELDSLKRRIDALENAKNDGGIKK